MLHRWAPIWSTITAVSVTSMVGSVYLAQAPGLTDEMLQMWCKIRPDLCSGVQPRPAAQPTTPTANPLPPQQPAPSSAAQTATSSARSATVSGGTQSSAGISTVSTNDAILGLEIKGPTVGKIGTSMNISYKIFNRTNQQQTNLSYSMILPMVDTTTLRPGQGCSITGRTLTCSNLAIPANSNFFGSFTIPVTQSSCSLQPSLPVTVTKLSALGSVESSVSAIHRWTWNCTYDPVATDVADVSVVVPARAVSDQPISLPVTIKNKSAGAIGYRLVLDLPSGVRPESFPGCGWSGNSTSARIMCFSNTTLGAAQQFTYTFGKFTFGRELCGTTVQLNPIRVEANTESGPAIIYGRTLTPISIPVECGPVVSSSSSAQTASSTTSSEASSEPELPYNGIDRFSITNGTATCVTSDCRTVNVPLSLRNTGPTAATRVAMVVTMDNTWSSATLQGVACLTMNINGTNERRFMCPGGFDLTVPAGATSNYNITLTTSTPCPIANPRAEVLIQSAPASVSEEDYSNNSVFVPLPRPCQPVSSASSSRASSAASIPFESACQINPSLCASSSRSSAASSSAPGTDAFTLQSINIAGQYVRVDYTKNFDTCAHLLTTGGQITHLQNHFCGRSGPVTISLSNFNTLFGAGKTLKLCHGNNGNICSNTVTVTETPDVPADDRNPVYMRFPLEGQWNYNPKPCYTDDCRRIVMPLELGNKHATATDVMISGVVGSMWNSMTVKGLTCELRTNTTQNGKTYTCPKMSIPANISGYTVGVVLNSTSPCPVANAPFVRLAFTGALKTSQQFPSDIARTIPLPCNGATLPDEPASSVGTSTTPPSLTVRVTANRAVAGTPAAVRMRTGDFVTFSSVTEESGVINSSYTWNWDTSVLECTEPGRAFGNNALYCTALAQGDTSVNITVNAEMSDDTRRTVTSNAIAVNVTPGAPTSSAPIVCGNGIVQAFEICDDGNRIDTDSCKNNCTINFNPQSCGNGVREGTEQCDDGNKDNTDLCTDKCTNIRQPVCGDGLKEGSEQCDDGNRIDTDSCSSSCTVVSSEQPGRLTLTQISTPSATAFSGHSNIPVMRFTASADVDSLVLDSIGFTVSQPNGVTFSLWRDTNNDGSVDTKVSDLVQTNSSFSTGQITGLGGHIETGAERLFEVRASIGAAVFGMTSITNASFLPLSVKANVGGTQLNGEKFNAACGSYCAINIKTTTSFSPTISIYRSGTLFIRPDTSRYPRNQQLKPGQTGESALNLLLDARLEDMSLEQIQFAIPIAAAGTVNRLEIFDQETQQVFGTASPETCIYDYGNTYNKGSVFCADMPRGTFVIPAGQTKAIGVRPVIESLEKGAIINAPFAVSLRLDPHTVVIDPYNIRPYSIGLMNANGFTRCSNSLVCATGMTSNTQVKQLDHADTATLYKKDLLPSEVVITIAPATQQLWRHYSITGPVNTIISGGTTPVTLSDANKNNDMSIGVGITGIKDATCLTEDCRKILVPMSLYTKGITSFNYTAHISANVDPVWTSVSLRGKTCTVNRTYPHYDGLTIFDCPIVYVPGSAPTTYGLGMILETTAPCPLPESYTNVILSFSPGTWDAIHYPNDRPVPVLPVPCNGQTGTAGANGFLGSILQWFNGR